MEFARTKNTARNSVLSIVEKVFVTLLPFVVRTVIIYKLGVEYTGLNSLFTTILSIVNLADIGFGAAVQFFLYKPVAEDDYHLINALFNFLRKAYYIIAAIVIVVGLCVTPFIPYLIKDGTCPPDINLYILYTIFVFNAAFTYCFGADFLIIIGVYQKDSIKHITGSLGEILKCAMQILILLLFKNYYFYAALIPLTTVICNLIYYFISLKLFPWVKASGKIDQNYSKELKKKLVVLFFHHLASVMTNTVDTLVISFFLGLTSLGNYGNYVAISSGITGVIMVLFTAFKPIIGNHLAVSSREEIFKLYKSVSLLFGILIIFVSVCMVGIFQPFITFWVGEQSLLSTATLVFFVLFNYCSLTRHFISNIYISGAGLWQKTIIREYVVAIINIVLDIVLIRNMGVTGIVLASFIAEGIIALPLDYYVGYKYVLKESPKKIILPQLQNLIYVLIFGCAAYLATYYLPLAGLTKLLVSIIIVVVIASVPLLVFVYKRPEFHFIKTKILSLFKKG